MFDASATSVPSFYIEGSNGISINEHFPGKNALRHFHANVVYGNNIAVEYLGHTCRLRGMPSQPFSIPIVPAPVRYVSHPSNQELGKVELIQVGNVRGPLTIEGSGAATRVIVNPIYSYPNTLSQDFVRNPVLPGWVGDTRVRISSSML